MKLVQKGMLVLAGLLSASMLHAQDSVEGTWAGKLQVTPDTAITVLFELSREGEQWQAMLNSPDMGAIKDVKATAVTFADGKLDIQVDSLSGAYSGMLANGSFEGEWTQPGATIPMNLDPYVATVLSEEAKAILLGQWHGKLMGPGITFNIVFHFTRDEDGNFKGELQNADAGPNRQLMTDVSLENGELFFRIPNAGVEYTGSIDGESITGGVTQGGRMMELNVVKGEYVAEVSVLDLDDTDYEQLAGRWTGSLSVPGATLTLVLRVERDEQGNIVAFIDSPDQGANGLRVTSASLEEGKLAFALTVPPARYEGTLADGGIDGEWIQGGMTNELDLSRE